MKELLATILIAATFLSISFVAPTNSTLDQDQAKAAFNHLNNVRASPDDFSKEIGANLKRVDKRPALIWNDVLAKVAEEKAMDMATKNYMAHKNKKGEGINILMHRAGYELDKEWVKNKSNNYFESIQAGTANGAKMINDLILDEYDRSLGHRKHLLGMDDWNASLVDCGIGIAHNPDSKYQVYSVVIIAKQSY